MRQNPHHVLLDPLSTYLLAKLSPSTAMIRLAAVLWGAALPCAVWRLARTALDETTSLFAALLGALSLLHVDWSRRADFYALLPVLPALQAAAWLELEKDPRRWKGFAFWSAVFALAHPYGAAAPLAYGLLAWTNKKARPAYLKGAACAYAAFLPWFAYSTRALLDHELFDFRGVPGQLTLPQFVARAPLYLAHAPEVGLGRTWAFGTGAVLALCYVGSYLYAAFQNDKPRLVRLCVLAAPLGLVAVAAIDLRYRYYFNGRQLLVVLPFYLIAVADGASRLLTRARIPLWAAAFVLAAAWLPLYTEATAAQIELQTGFDRMAEQVGRGVKPGDSFAFAHDGLAMGFLYHYDRAAFLGAEGFKIFGGYGGHLSYLLPAGLTAKGVPVRIEPWNPDAPPSSTAWTFHGTMYDFYVEPPLRAKGVAATPALPAR